MSDMTVTMRDRARAALRGWRMPDKEGAGRNALKARAAQPLMVWPSHILDQPQWNIVDLQSYITYGFNLNSIIYSAIMYKARAANAAPLRGYHGGQESPEMLPDDHPLAQLLARPNPFQSAYEFMGLNTVYFNLSGNAYIYFARQRPGDTPYAMYTLRPDCVRIVPGKEAERPVIGFVYVPEGGALNDGFPILADDLMHVKLPNPADPLNGAGYGLSPLSAIAQSANVDNDVTRFLKVFFQKGAMFQNVISYDVPMVEKEMSDARDRFEEIYGGVENWSKVAVLDQGGKVQRLNPTFEEMGFEVIDARNEARILGPFGVPPILIGTRLGLTSATYSNYELARQAFWEDTMLPELRLFENEFRYFLAGKDTFVRYDMSEVPALRRDMVQLTSAALNLYQIGTPPRLAFAAVGLDVEEFPGDDLPPMPAMPGAGMSAAPVSARAESTPAEEMTPGGESTQEIPANVETVIGLNGIQIQAALSVLEQVGIGVITPLAAVELLVALGIERARAALMVPSAPTVSRAEPEEEGAQKALPLDLPALAAPARYDPVVMQHKMDTLSVSFEKRYGDMAARLWADEERELRAILNGAQREARHRKAIVNWTTLMGTIKDWYEKERPEAWRTAYVPLIEATMLDAGREWAAALGVQWSVRNLQGEDWFQRYALKFADPITEVSSEQVHQVLEKALADGWSIPQTQERLGMVFQQWAQGNLTQADFEWLEARMPAYRRENIARTETIRASNSGALELGKSWGVKRKGWQATLDGRQREDHEDAFRRYSEGGNPGLIPVDEAFVVGGVQMMYPGDPAGTPEQFCQCRCTVLLYTD